jgi:BirA family biotin operon repressor/biotin-[acetyl-CoA-carboxylase] ligase
VTSAAPDIRWPNDILLGGRKLGGILTELNAEVTRVRHAVVGIGINVHQPEFPPELAGLATSLRLETGEDWPRQELLVALLTALQRELDALAGPGAPDRAASSIRKRLEEASTWVRGRLVTVTEVDTYSGITDGLDDRGFLRVQTADGVRIVMSGGVREGGL